MYLTQRSISSLNNPQNNDSYALLVIKASILGSIEVLIFFVKSPPKWSITKENK
jgi:hypothetical protein